MQLPPSSQRTVIAGQTGYGVPLVVAVTGHRDLVEAERAATVETVRSFLGELLDNHPDRGVTVMSSLAEGADQLVAEVALELEIPLIAPLPMPLPAYIDDFPEGPARERFTRLLDQASEVFELPITPGNSPATIEGFGGNRARQYAQLGVYLCAHCHILLALWDGKYNDQLGGTGQVVRFHHDDVMPGYTPRSTASRLILTDDESDLVYHVVCSRDRPDGGPAQGLAAGEAWWFTTDVDKPRTHKIPQRHQRVFAYTGDFSRDARRYEERIRDEAWPLLDDASTSKLPAAIRDVDKVFRIADWLAIHFQKRTLAALRSIHALAFLMGLMYILYSDLLPRRIFIVAFVSFFLIAAALQTVSRRQQWHRKYLDYRTLAEGLRVQFYWAAAGVRSETVSKFSHDNFLQMQDSELGWIRNVMRVAGMEINANPYREKFGLDFAIREWIGDKQAGQLGYFRRKALERVGRNRYTETLGRAFVWVSIAAFGLFVFAPESIADQVRDPIVIMMGVLLLIVGVRQSYAFSTADFELIKQYDFMYRTFRKAKRHLGRVTGDDERRDVLRILGDAALEEHSEWILMHRERSMDQGEIWRMSG